MSTNQYTDHLGHHRAQALQHALFNLIDGQQKAATPQEGFTALVVLTIMEAELLGINLSEVVSYARNAIDHMDQTDTEKMRAIREFIKNEVTL